MLAIETPEVHVRTIPAKGGLSVMTDRVRWGVWQVDA